MLPCVCVRIDLMENSCQTMYSFGKWNVNGERLLTTGEDKHIRYIKVGLPI